MLKFQNDKKGGKECKRRHSTQDSTLLDLIARWTLPNDRVVWPSDVESLLEMLK
jgi:hypothetical protein